MHSEPFHYRCGGVLRLALKAMAARPMLLLAIVVATLVLPVDALAQAAIGMDVDSILNATKNDTDWSIRLWRSLFGNFALDPFSMLGAPTTLLGSAFLIFNSGIFVVGFVWALFGIVSGVIHTAHEGEVLGRRMSTVWFPIRMIMGIAGMVPIFGGFTLNQALMMLLTTIGIGIGNMVWNGTIEASNQFQGLVANQPFASTTVNQVRDATRVLFEANVCMATENELVAKGTGVLPVQFKMRNVQMNGHEVGVVYEIGTSEYPEKCGIVAVSITTRSGSSNPFDSLGYRVDSVDYQSIQNAMMAVYTQNFQILLNGTSNLAAQWLAAHKAAVEGGGDLPPVPVKELEALNKTFSNSMTARAALVGKEQAGAITKSAEDNMKSMGWFGAGAWYATLAEANAAIADATKGPTLTGRSIDQQMPRVASVTADAVASARTSWSAQIEAQGQIGDSASKGDGFNTLVDSAVSDNGCEVWGKYGNNYGGTATGNCSFGQGLVSAAIRGLAIGSGGGGNGGSGSGMLSLDSSGFVNPIIMMKNMGDYVMGFSSTLLLGGFAAKALEFVTGKTPLGFASTTAAKVAEKALGSSLGTEIMAVLKIVAVIALVVGAAMSIYIPLIPFITWMGAILAYCASMIEGLAGATLHAMAHLDGDGDGLGQRTTHGYLFFVNAVARPALMIIGFLVASALMIAVGTLQAVMFLPAMANVQGNSVTGLFSIIMFLVVFFVINLTLITACFNLIYVITDQVIGFVGGAIDSRLGRDTEDKVNNMFLMAARVGPSATAQIGGARRAAQLAGDGAAGAGAGGRTVGAGGIGPGGGGPKKPPGTNP